jgi:hypothetical protein
MGKYMKPLDADKASLSDKDFKIAFSFSGTEYDKAIAALTTSKDEIEKITSHMYALAKALKEDPHPDNPFKNLTPSATNEADIKNLLNWVAVSQRISTVSGKDFPIKITNRTRMMTDFFGGTGGRGILFGDIKKLDINGDKEIDYSDLVAAAKDPDSPEFQVLQKLLKTNITDNNKKKIISALKAAGIQRQAGRATQGNYQTIGDTQSTGIQTKDRADILEPFGSVAASYGDVAVDEKFRDLQKKELKNLKSVKIDVSVANSVASIPGTNLFEKLGKVLESFDNLKDNKRLTGRELARVANEVKFVNLLGQAVQEYEASSSGTAFETFLALLASGVVVGAESGAIDVVGGDGTLMSAKLLSQGDISQAMGDEGGIGIEAIMGEQFDDVIYVAGLKREKILPQYKNAVTLGGTGGGFEKDVFSANVDKIKEVDFVILKIQKTQAGKKQGYVAHAMGANGTYSPVDPPKVESGSSGGARLKMNESLIGAYKKGLIALSVPILPEAAGMARNITELLNQNVDANVNKTLKEIAGVYKKLKNMEINTQDYIALQAKQQPTSVEIDKRINQIITDYDKVKDDFNATFDAFAGLKAADKTKQTTSRVKESKSPLDQLIEAIVKEKLSK